MTETAAFDTPWYPNMMERFGERASPDARAIMAGLCMLAHALDGVTSAIKGVSSDIASWPDDLADALHHYGIGVQPKKGT